MIPVKPFFAKDQKRFLMILKEGFGDLK